MRIRLPDPGRLVPVRLTDVDTGARLRALEVLLRREDNPLRRYELLMAALRPSETVYLVPYTDDSAPALDRVLSAKSEHAVPGPA